MNKKPKPKDYVFGRPRNEQPTEKVQIRWSKPVADFIRENKGLMIDMVERLIKKKDRK